MEVLVKDVRCVVRIALSAPFATELGGDGPRAGTVEIQEVVQTVILFLYHDCIEGVRHGPLRENLGLVVADLPSLLRTMRALRLMVPW